MNESQKAEALADKWMSIYVRLKYANEFGMCNCFTCDKYIKWKAPQPHGAHNGHFIKRGNNPKRYDEKNCRVQCYDCNVVKNGNDTVFAEKLNIEAGYDIAAELKRDSKETVLQTANILRQIAKVYKLKSKERPNHNLFKEKT